MLSLAAAIAATATLAAPSAGDAWVAMVIGNDRSLSDARPDLQYADDDARHMAAVLEGAGGYQVRLLVSGGDRSPTQAHAAEAARELHALVDDARKHGQRTHFLFFFAGHGDAENGKGALELEDARLRKDDLRALVDTVDADVAHVVLDACNSFFVVHPRRPGGRTFATQRDLTGGLTATRGAPGVFLSTSAEAQVFEWSQLEGGIFTYVVRSGLVGGADADGDGLVRYGELLAFATSAVGDIVDEVYRPQLYVRPPSPLSAPGDDVLIDLRNSRTRAVTLAGFDGRVTVRDDAGHRLVDVHPEHGWAPSLRLPSDALEIAAEIRGDDGRVHVASTMVPRGDQAITLAPSALGDASTARGSPAALERLFLRAFGPSTPDRATSTAQTAPDEVYGLTRAQEQRISLELEVFARDAGQRRLALGLAAGVGAVAGAGLFGGLMLASDGKGAGDPTVLAAGAVLVALPAVAVAPLALWPTDEEQVYDTFARAPAATPRQRAARAAAAVTAYEAAAHDEDLRRFGVAAALVGGGLLVGAEGLALSRAEFTAVDDHGNVLADEPFTEVRVIGAGTLAVAAGAVAAGVAWPFVKTSPTETLSALLQRDPEPVLAP